MTTPEGCSPGASAPSGGGSSAASRTAAGVEYVLAPDDGRVLAIHVPGDFTGYGLLPPTIDRAEPTPAGVEARTTSALMAATKGHVTPADWPLQVLVLRRGPGSAVRPHMHWAPARPAQNAVAHQVLICQEGRARIGVLTSDGTLVAELELGPRAFVLLTEGHAVDFIETDTRLIEVKQGPALGVDVDDKIELPQRASPDAG